MKLIHVILACIVTVINSHAQSLIQLGADVSTNVSDQQSISVYSNSLGTPFVAYMSNNNLYVMRNIGGVWQNTTTGMDPIEVNVKDFDIHHNLQTDETVLIYTKTDGLYVKEYSSTWSGGSVLSTTNAENSSTCLLSVDESSNMAYIIFNEFDGFISTPSFVTFDLTNNVFGSFDTNPSFSNYIQIASSDFQCDQQSGNLFLGGYGESSTNFDKYDGINWSSVETAFPYPTVFRFRFGISNSIPSNIVLGEIYNSAGGYHYRLSSYNSLTNASTILDPIVNLGTSPYEMTDIAVSPLNDYATFAITEAFGNSPSILKYYDGNAVNEISHNLGQDLIDDCAYDPFGNLLLATLQNGVLKVFKMNSFTTGVAELKENENVSIYPNPATSIIQVDTQEKILKIDLYTSTGKFIATTTETTIDLSKYDSGIYQLKVFSNDGTYIKRVIKN